MSDPLKFVDYFDRKITPTRVNFDEDMHRTGEGACLFANGISIGMATPGDCQGIKMEFDYGVTAVVTGTGKGVVGLDIKMTMDKDWDFTTRPDNGTVRGARIQVVSEDDVSGRIEGAYINAIASGTKAIEGYISGATPVGPGIIGIEARTELQTSAQITTTGVTGVLIFCRIKQDADIISTASQGLGFYRGLQVEVPMMGTGASIEGTTDAIRIAKDWGGTDIFDYGLYIATGTCDNGIGIVVAAATASGRYGIYVNNSYTKTDGGVHKAISSVVTYTPATSGYSTPIAVVGKVVLDGNFTGGTGYLWGVQGQLHLNDSAVLNNVSSIAAAGRFVMTADATPTFTEFGFISCIYCDNLISYDMNGLSTGKSTFLSLWNSGGEMDAAINVFGGNQIPVLFRFDSCGGTDQGHMVEAGAVKTGASANIAVDWEGTVYYINMLQA